MSNVVLVTATSFMKSYRLRSELEAVLSALSSPPEIHYLDLRNTTSLSQLQDPQWAKRVSSWLVGGERVSESELQRFPHLRQISKYGVGLDNIDFEACRDQRVAVYFEPGVNSLAVAEHSLGLILGMIRNLFHNSNKLKDGVWNKDGGRGLAGLLVSSVSGTWGLN
jgi:phosphoglycerate dehydrogenase-like enzyme